MSVIQKLYTKVEQFSSHTLLLIPTPESINPYKVIDAALRLYCNNLVPSKRKLILIVLYCFAYRHDKHLWRGGLLDELEEEATELARGDRTVLLASS